MINQKNKRKFYNVLLLLLMLIVILPVIWMVFLAFRPSNRMFDKFWKLPIEITLSNFEEVATKNFFKSIFNSFFVGIIASVISIILGAPAGFAMARWEVKQKIKGISLWLVLLLRMAPPVGFALPLFLVYVRLHLVDTYTGLILSYMTITLPLVIWLMWMFFLDIPKEIFESAFVDGTNVLQAFTKMGIPLVKPCIFASGILSFGACWNDFFFALVLTRSRASTGTVAVMNFLKETGFNWGGITSACLILIIPALPISYFMQKYLVQGLTSGSVKG